MSIPPTSLLWIVIDVFHKIFARNTLFESILIRRYFIFNGSVTSVLFYLSPMFSSITILQWISDSFLICIKHYLHAAEVHIHIAVT